MKLRVVAAGAVGDVSDGQVPHGPQLGPAAITPAFPRRMARADSFDWRFHYCQRPVPHESWRRWRQLGSPTTHIADIDLSIPAVRAHQEARRIRCGLTQPQHLIVSLTGAELFKCPMIMMQEVGRLFFNEEDTAQLRKVSAQGWLPLGGRLLGIVRLERVVDADHESLSAERLPDHGFAGGSSNLPHDVRSESDSRRFQASATGAAVAAERRSAAPTVHRCTHAESPIATAASWC
jgi:hypothetical protein